MLLLGYAMLLPTAQSRANRVLRQDWTPAVGALVLRAAHHLAEPHQGPAQYCEPPAARDMPSLCPQAKPEASRLQWM